MEQLHFKKKDSVRTRYAPSPTGPLHIGGVRTALFNYLFSRKNQGSFILRIEDTDFERSDPKWEEDIISNLEWLGISWDEGPAPISQKEIGEITNSKLQIPKNEKCVGDYGPYRQSERKEIYEKYIKKLFDDGYLYWCFCSKEDLEAQKQDQMARGEAPRYLGHCRNLSKKERENFRKKGRKGILRFKVPREIIKVQDLIRGKMEFNASLLGDIAVARDFKTPLYNLAVVIDDFEMKINYVIRGEDHLSNTPKQIIFQEALDMPRPKYAHLPLILGSDRSKISKRHGTVKMGDYKKEGYLPKAFLNFMALLGWNPGTNEEIFSLEDLVQRFSLERVQKGGAIFNSGRLDWINGYYIRKMPIAELTEKCALFFQKSGMLNKKNGGYEIQETKEIISFNYLENIVSLSQERMKKLSEITELSDFFFKDKLKYSPETLLWKDIEKKEIKKNLKICHALLEKIEEKEWQAKKIKEVLMEEAEKGKDRGRILWPLRAALSGKKNSPPPFEIADVLGKEKTKKRINEAINLL